jgi:hypothetical protein
MWCAGAGVACVQGNIAAWRKAEGDSVQPGDILAEIETDKATIEWEAQEEGFIAKILKPAGQHMHIAGACQADRTATEALCAGCPVGQSSSTSAAVMQAYEQQQLGFGPCPCTPCQGNTNPWPVWCGMYSNTLSSRLTTCPLTLDSGSVMRHVRLLVPVQAARMLQWASLLLGWWRRSLRWQLSRGSAREVGSPPCVMRSHATGTHILVMLVV